jgi:hypothetical protein
MRNEERELRKKIAKEINAKYGGREVMTEEEKKIRKNKRMKKKLRKKK